MTYSSLTVYVVIAICRHYYHAKYSIHAGKKTVFVHFWERK
jgi:hypothetical protein